MVVASKKAYAHENETVVKFQSEIKLSRTSLVFVSGGSQDVG